MPVQTVEAARRSVLRSHQPGAPTSCVTNVLLVAGVAIGLAPERGVTGGAGGARRSAIDWVKSQVATVTRQATFRVALDAAGHLHPLVVQRMKLIAAPLLL
jgi:hypothetical protein